MRNMDKFDIIELYKYYSKNIINENVNAKIFLKEDVINSVLPVSKTGKFKPILYYKEKMKPPFMFEVDFNFTVDFNILKISEDFSYESVEDSNDIPVNIPDSEVEKLINKKMSDIDSNKTVVKKKRSLNIDSFYYDVFRKKLAAQSISGRINDFVRSGVIYIGEFKIPYASSYSVQMNDELMLRKIEDANRKNKKTTGPIKCGYQVMFESTNKTKSYVEADYINFIDKFGEGFANSVLKNTEYYTIKA